jgi:hypothetical protein
MFVATLAVELEPSFWALAVVHYGMQAHHNDTETVK